MSEQVTPNPTDHIVIKGAIYERSSLPQEAWEALSYIQWLIQDVADHRARLSALMVAQLKYVDDLLARLAELGIEPIGYAPPVGAAGEPESEAVEAEVVPA